MRSPRPSRRAAAASPVTVRNRSRLRRDNRGDESERPRQTRRYDKAPAVAGAVVGTAGFEFNSPHAGLLFYRHLRASQRPYWHVVYRPHRRASAASEPIRRTMSSAKSGLLCLDSRLQLLGCRGARKLLQEVVAFSDPLRFKPTHSDSLHSNSFTRRATRAVVGADCEKADGIYLKRPPPAQAPCPRANPGLHLATLQASGRVALAPRRCAVTRA